MEVVRRVCPHWTPQSHLIKLPLSPMFAYTDNCWDSGRKQLIYNGTENSPARLSWHCSRKDTALSIPGMGFCNAYIPWSPRLLHEQWDFKNRCRWWWVTQAHQELSEHQSCQLHTQSDNACETNGRCGRASLRDHTRHLSLQPQGEGRSELYQRPPTSCWGPKASPRALHLCSSLLLTLHCQISASSSLPQDTRIWKVLYNGNVKANISIATATHA